MVDIIFSHKYRRTQNSRDLDQSIKHFERVSDLYPMDHSYRPAYILVEALMHIILSRSGPLHPCFRYCRMSGVCREMNRVPCIKSAGFAPRGSPRLVMTFNNLAAQLCSRFHHRGNDEDFGSGYRTSQGGAGLVPSRLRQSVQRLNHLAHRLSTCVEHQHNMRP
ncbi:uncharacterized protein EDB93DRAFT_265462 [Suillus bovinus]|uniref:uncharacterized protein n=1 Tax=Suillus bovinus TaxID=48563 RepID=UPI001B87664A|nr:uncharacterized protein EDB93DRAFT_265462 [Suillus bovinus]KAG2151612.1 hypothetical protein EDB93DRAFT_265462 [Suillus bovinus]